jgi:mRNA interferase RelE/StbE
MYEVRLVSSAAKEYRSLDDKVKDRVADVFDKLETNPRPLGVRKLKGHERLYRMRVGAYRIVYEIDDARNLVRVTRIRHRSEAYR